VHVGSLLFDPYAQLRLVDLVLPFDGAYRPLWLGLGTTAFDLLLAVVATSLARHRLGRRSWRTVHWLGYIAWPLAVLHAIGTGTDAGSLWLRALAAACILAVGTSLAWRHTPSGAPAGIPTGIPPGTAAAIRPLARSETRP
jgi:sulfoxide reductase heme-binding subunit YedZ